MKFIGNCKGCKHSYFLRVHGAGRIRDRLHFFVHIFCELLNVSFVQLTADDVGLTEDLDFDQ